ncbi:hypothetical protein NC652_037231 [Populus alba x Populus x berolinensis]|nr:hypothetical protein NC652_037231 [Populus alba x Populus x berolinensis]
MLNSSVSDQFHRPQQFFLPLHEIQARRRPTSPPVTPPGEDPSSKRASYEKPTTEIDCGGDDGGEASGLRLLGLLLQCAECVAMDNLNDATDLLPEIAELSSPFGSSPERVGAYFAHALQARVVGSCLGVDSVERHMVEQQLFGCEIRNIVAVGGPKRTGEVKVERWGDELRRVGFEPVSLGGSPAAQASLLLGMFPWKGYTLVEENGCLKLGWKDLSLLTASAWHPSD